MASCRAAWLLVVVLAAGCGGRAVPASCHTLELRARPVVTRLRVDLFTGAPLAPLAPAPHLRPGAPIRSGQAASRELFAELRQAAWRGDCRFAAQLVDQVAVDASDHEYARYLDAWCEYDHGSKIAAYAILAELSRLGSDPGLRGFIAGDLIAMLARSAPGAEGVAVLTAARLAQPPYLDRYLAALVAVRREHEAGALWSSTDLETPLADDALCRRTLADCRRDLAATTWKMARWTCQVPHRPRTPPACRAALALAQQQALLSWDGSHGAEADVRAVVLALRGHPALAGRGDELDLLLLATRWDGARREPRYWRELGADAAVLARRATPRAVAVSAKEVAARAGENAELLARAGCQR